MTDFVPNGTGNSRFLKSVSNFLTLYPTYSDFVAALIAGTLPVDFNGVNSAGYSQLGSALKKANLLPDATCTLLGIATSSEVKDALNLIANNKFFELLSTTVSTAASSISLDLSGLSTENYSRLIVEATIFTSAATTVNCTINNITSEYYGNMIFQYAVNGVNNHNFGSFSTGATDSSYANPTQISMDIRHTCDYATSVTYDRRYANITFSGINYTANYSSMGSVYIQTGASSSVAVSSVQFVAASGNIMAGSIFKVYGVKK